ncbi:MAG: DUF2946 domain-containing protein [Rhodocyclaceae bacterium]
MFRPTHLLRLIARITLAFVLMAALAPTISHALAAYEAAQAWAGICSVSPSHSAASHSTDEHEAPTQHHSAAFEHCPFCLKHATPLVLPTADRSLAGAPLGAAPVPLLFLHAPRPLPAWSTAQSRAPPPA